MQHLIDIASMDLAQVKRVYELSDYLAGHSDELRDKKPLHDKIVANLFFENSTRTRVSFEVAAAQLGAQVINLSAAGSSMSKGESLQDTFYTLCAMGVELFNVRHSQVGAPRRLADASPAGVHIINAGDGVHAHPTQALLDIYTLQKHLGDLKDKTIVIVGDLQHSRVARSDIALLKLLGVKSLRLAAPPKLHLQSPPSTDIAVFPKLNDALQDADAVIMLRIQKERLSQAELPDDDKYHQHWGLTKERLKLCKPSCKVLHPGPVNRGVEITDEVLDGPQSLVLEQVRAGIYVRMAVMLAMFQPDWPCNALHC